MVVYKPRASFHATFSMQVCKSYVALAPTTPPERHGLSDAQGGHAHTHICLCEVPHHHPAVQPRGRHLARTAHLGEGADAALVLGPQHVTLRLGLLSARALVLEQRSAQQALLSRAAVVDTAEGNSPCRSHTGGGGLGVLGLLAVKEPDGGPLGAHRRAARERDGVKLVAATHHETVRGEVQRAQRKLL